MTLTTRTPFYEVERAISVRLTGDFYWFSVEGRKLFSTYGATGLPTNAVVAVLIWSMPRDSQVDFGYSVDWKVVDGKGSPAMYGEVHRYYPEWDGLWINFLFVPFESYESAMKKIDAGIAALDEARILDAPLVRG